MNFIPSWLKNIEDSEGVPVSYFIKAQTVLRINNGCYFWLHTPNGDIDIFVEFPFNAGIPKKVASFLFCVVFPSWQFSGSSQMFVIKKKKTQTNFIPGTYAVWILKKMFFTM